MNWCYVGRDAFWPKGIEVGPADFELLEVFLFSSAQSSADVYVSFRPYLQNMFIILRYPIPPPHPFYDTFKPV